MKDFFQKLGFRKMDEMQRLIALKAQRNALAYAVAFLLVWSLYGSFQTRAAGAALNTVPGFLLSTIALVLIGSQFYYQHKALGGTEEEGELVRSFAGTFALGLLLVLAVLALGVWALVARG